MIFKRTGPRRPKPTKLAIRPEVPLARRVGAVVVLVTVVAVVVYLAYDSGLRFAGYISGNSRSEIAGLRDEIAQLRTQLAEAQRLTDTSASRLQVEQTAQDRLAKMIKHLEAENERFKAELAVFERLASNEGAKAGLAISRVNVSEEGPGRYRYRLLVARPPSERTVPFKGRLEIEVNLVRAAQTVIMNLPSDGANPAFAVDFRHFKRIEGLLELAPDERLVSMRFHLSEDGKRKASELFEATR